jgi:LysM repeat protein
MATPTTIKSTDQAIGAFGTTTDALSLVRNMVEGAVNKDMIKVGQAATDAIKLGIYYADLLGKESGNAGLVNSVASLALKLKNLSDKLSSGQATNYADWAEVVAEAGGIGGDVALQYGKNPAALEAGLYLKGGSLISYSAVVLGHLSITEQAQVVTVGRDSLQKIDSAMGGSSSLTINSNANTLNLAQDFIDGSATSLSVTSTTNKAIVVQRLNKILQPTKTFEIYIVQRGDTLSALDAKYGLAPGTVAKFNTDITNPNNIYEGEQIFVPRAVLDNNQSAVPSGVTVGANQFYIGGLYNDLSTIASVTGLSVAYLKTLNPTLNENTCYAPGTLVNLIPASNLTSLNYNDLSSIDKTLNQLYGNGLVSAGLKNSFTYSYSNWLLTPSLTQQIAPFALGYNPADPYGFGPSLNLDPIGAFYESVTPALDIAPSIADKTPVLLGANNSGLSVSALTTRDANFDGQLTGTELTGLNLWVDANENGLLETGELRSLATAGISQIKSADYGFYTQGNAVIGTGVAAEPVRPNESSGVPAAVVPVAMPAQPLRVNFIQAVPASNYATLRATDNTYAWSDGYYMGSINWAPTQIKINYANQSYLIGTDNADGWINADGSFTVVNANYYSGNPIFNTNLLTNFLAGGGDDVFGGLGKNCDAANDDVFEMRKKG